MVSLSERRLHYPHAALMADSMRAAAERLGAEASVISRQIQLIEKELSVSLTDVGAASRQPMRGAWCCRHTRSGA